MSLIDFILGKSSYDKARDLAKELFLANKITESEYIELMDEIEVEENT